MDNKKTNSLPQGPKHPEVDNTNNHPAASKGKLFIIKNNVIEIRGIHNAF